MNLFRCFWNPQHRRLRSLILLLMILWAFVFTFNLTPSVSHPSANKTKWSWHYLSRPHPSILHNSNKIAQKMFLEFVANETFKNSTQTDHRILDYIVEHHLIAPKNDAYNLTPLNPEVNKMWSNPVVPYILAILENKEDGFFIECGANDGEFLSNTLTLELNHSWTGLLIEADPVPFSVLAKRNRKAWLSDVCLATKPYPHMVEMLRHKQHPGLTYIEQFLEERQRNDYVQFNATCFPLFSLLSALNVSVVDYFSLDIEGADLAVLKTFPFDGPIFIKVISVEILPGRGKELPLKQFLTSKGYIVVEHVVENGLTDDYIFVHESVPGSKSISPKGRKRRGSSYQSYNHLTLA